MNRLPSNGHNVPPRVKKQLEWSARSGRDLLAIDAYISADNPVVAGQVVDYIISQAEQLTRYPYNLIYRITRSKIRIVRVIHQSRLYP